MPIPVLVGEWLLVIEIYMEYHSSICHINDAQEVMDARQWGVFFFIDSAWCGRALPRQKYQADQNRRARLLPVAGRRWWQ